MKNGWKTTEFWMTVCTNIVTLVGALHGIIPADQAAIVIAAANGFYGILRAMTKTMSPTPTPPLPLPQPK